MKKVFLFYFSTFKLTFFGKSRYQIISTSKYLNMWRNEKIFTFYRQYNLIFKIPIKTKLFSVMAYKNILKDESRILKYAIKNSITKSRNRTAPSVPLSCDALWNKMWVKSQVCTINNCFPRRNCRNFMNNYSHRAIK